MSEGDNEDADFILEDSSSKDQMLGPMDERQSFKRKSSKKKINR